MLLNTDMNKHDMTCFSGDYISMETINMRSFFSNMTLFSRVPKKVDFFGSSLTFCNFGLSYRRRSQEETKIIAIAWISGNY